MSLNGIVALHVFGIQLYNPVYFICVIYIVVKIRDSMSDSNHIMVRHN